MSRYFRELQLRSELQQCSNTEHATFLEMRGLCSLGNRVLNIRFLAVVLSYEFYFEQLVLCDEFEPLI